MSAASEYLEALQKNCYSNLGLVPKTSTQLIEEFRKADFSHILNKTGLFNKDVTAQKEFIRELETLSLPTDFEDPLVYSILNNHSASIEQSISEFKLTLPFRPIIGTLPSGRVNAMAIALPTGSDFLVVFERCVLVFAGSLCRIAASMFPQNGCDEHGRQQYRVPKNPEEVDNLLSENPSAQKDFEDLLFSYLFNGDVSFSSYVIPETATIPLKHLWVQSMELFIMGHEYAHIVLGHLSAGLRTRTHVAGQTVEEITPEWDQEIEADCLGIQLMLAAMRRNRIQPVLSFQGAELFFDAIEVVERGVALLACGDENRHMFTTHPPSSERRSIVRQLLEPCLGNDSAKAGCQIAEILQAIINRLWVRAKPILLSLHDDKGYQLAPIWRQ